MILMIKPKTCMRFAMNGVLVIDLIELILLLKALDGESPNLPRYIGNRRIQKEFRG